MSNETTEGYGEIKISVRNLVEFILRSGDIDNRRGSGQDKEAMQLGNKIHRKIQKSMGAAYTPEVPLKITKKTEQFQIVLEGRADGILVEDEEVTIDEIKGVFMDLYLLEAPLELHLAQAKCYAYIYSLQKELPQIKVQMTYCNLESEEIKRFQQSYTFPELEKWFYQLMEEYEKWAAFQYEWRKIRNASVKQIEFPFAYREGQKDLARAVYRTFLHKKRLFIQASTGVGKTIATLFPAIKAVGEAVSEKIFYLTAKTITRTVAEDAFTLLKEQGLQYKVTTITAKEKVCFCDEMECNPAACEYAKGHYDRVNDAVFDIINNEQEFNRQMIETYAEKHQVCPFEFCLDISTWSDAVICDYNYVFDPNVHLRRFFGEGVKGEYLFLIDEAHNLVDRSRSMYSASIYKESFLQMKQQLKTESIKLVKLLEKCNQELLSLKRECETYQLIDGTPNLYLHLLRLFSELETYLEECETESIRSQVLEFYFVIRQFIYIYERLDENYQIYTEHTEEGRFHLKLLCVEPAASLKEYLDKGSGAVFFSATLLPMHYYKGLLGNAKEDYAVYAESTFPEERRRILLANDVSSKYTRRTYSEFSRIASYIWKTARARKGNYIVFFPSYKFMEQVLDCFEEQREGDEIESLIQVSNMGEEEREIFLEAFSEDRKQGLVGFCVMGGTFSEGIDLKNDRLIGVLVVGTGLPMIGNEREILRSYYETREVNGFEYAYVFAGMNKVLQAAGRVIRTAEDKGIILLMDDRFYGTQYKKLFPREWKQLYPCNVHTVSDQLESFWGK